MLQTSPTLAHLSRSDMAVLARCAEEGGQGRAEQDLSSRVAPAKSWCALHTPDSVSSPGTSDICSALLSRAAPGSCHSSCNTTTIKDQLTALHLHSGCSQASTVLTLDPSSLICLGCALMAAEPRAALKVSNFYSGLKHCNQSTRYV